MDPENTQHVPNPSETIPVQPIPSSKSKLLLILLIILSLVVVGVGGIFLGKYFSASKSPVTIQPVISPVPTHIPTTDPAANWKTYTNTRYGYSVKYPTDFSVVETSLDYVRFSPGSNDPNLPQSQAYLSIQIDKSSQQSPESIYKITPDGKTLRISQVLMGVDENQKPQIKAIFDQILSTFKFLDQNPVPTQVTTKKYTVPSSWKKWAYDDFGLSYYLPPDWIAKTGGNIFWHRDNAFEPQRAYWNRVEYNGGSAQDQYIKSFDDYGQCGDQLTANTIVTELNINGLSVLKIVPKNMAVKVSCSVNPALIFIKGKWLHEFELWLTDSTSMEIYYTIVSSISPI